ncbi:minor tail protein [Mycobacterium phage Jabiru]|nr:minor tail protein [Mycobacterium phage Jabiru]
MTTPNQPAPDDAFVIGDDWGQNFTEAIIRGQFQIPEINLGNALSVMRDQLLKLPLEALEVFKPIIPDWIEDDFANVANAVSKIMSILTEPIRFLLEADWQEWLTGTWNGFQTVVNQIIDILRGLVVTPVNQAVQDIKDWWSRLTGKTQNLTTDGKLDAGQLIGQVSKNVVEGLEDLANNVIDGFKGIRNGWTGGNNATGSPQEVKQTIELIRTAIVGGYTIETIDTSQTWNKPTTPLVEFWAICIGGGGRGFRGGAVKNTSDPATALGGDEGIDGGYVAQQIDPELIPDTVDCTVGAAASAIGQAGQPTSFGSLVSSTPGVGSISHIGGYLVSTSKPGRGGRGGDATKNPDASYAGSPGEPSALGTPGNGGAANGGTGGAGGNASLIGQQKSGGGGGGGGGGRTGQTFGTVTGGTGGNGGYPGGGSGGGGAAANGGSIGMEAVGGAPGIPANGILFLMYK